MRGEWAPGRVIAERYRLVDLVARGGMGAVWRAEHLSLGSQVAIKQIETQLLGTSDAVARFLREARTVASLRTPHVVQVFDYGVDDTVPYMAMELLDGESLADRLDRVRTLTAAQTLRIVTHIARALTRAHEAGIVHRDLKPENVFLVQNEDEELAKVIDFGIAKLQRSADAMVTVATETGTLLGTPYYMSPEQARGRKVDHRTDLWALAVIAYECLCGSRPFTGATVGDVIMSICSDPIVAPSSFADVPPGFDEWFRRGVHRDRKQRFQSARELTTALGAILAPVAVDASEGISGPAWQPPDPGLELQRTVLGPSQSVPEAPALAPVAAPLSGAVPAGSMAPITLGGVQRGSGSIPPDPDARERSLSASARRAFRRMSVLGIAAGAVVFAIVVLALLVPFRNTGAPAREPSPTTAADSAFTPPSPSVAPRVEPTADPAPRVTPDAAPPSASIAPQRLPESAPRVPSRSRPAAAKRSTPAPIQSAEPAEPIPSKPKDPLAF